MSSRATNKSLEVGSPVPVQLGSTLHFYHDPSVASDDPSYHWTEVEVTGEGEVFTVPKHWHKYHDEIWEVVEGRFEITSGDRTFIMSAGDPVQRTPRRTVHGLKSFKGEKAVLRESTIPAGEFKEKFFRDLFATGTDASFWYVMRVFHEGDGYPDLGLGMQWLDELFVFVTGSLAKLFVPANKYGPSNTIAEQRQKTA